MNTSVSETKGVTSLNHHSHGVFSCLVAVLEFPTTTSYSQSGDLDGVSAWLMDSSWGDQWVARGREKWGNSKAGTHPLSEKRMRLKWCRLLGLIPSGAQTSFKWRAVFSNSFIGAQHSVMTFVLAIHHRSLDDRWHVCWSVRCVSLKANSLNSVLKR